VHWVWVLDTIVFHAAYDHPPGALMRSVTRLLLRVATGGVCWLALFALLFVGGGRRGRRIALTGALAVLLAHAAGVWGLQGLFQRPGPAETYSGVTLLAHSADPFSFPSGRVAQAFAAAPFLTRGSGAGPAVLWMVVAAIAYACVYAGASFPSDVAGGAALGLLCAAGAVWLLGNPFVRRRGHLVPLPRRVRGAAGHLPRQP
jgi:undecaprenyl-diphosphatase